MPHRHSLARLRSADDLAATLAVPIYYVMMGKAEPTFPQSFTAAPSYDVIIRWTDADLSSNLEKVRLPVYVHWKQWRTVCVPVLEDATYRTTNPLWIGLQGSLIRAIGEELRSKAVQAGYGSPGQVC